MAHDPLLLLHQTDDSTFEEEDNEEEAIHVPLWQQHREGGKETVEVESSSSSSASSVSSALLLTAEDDGIISDNHNNIDEQDSSPLSLFSPKLPWALILSYFLCGFTLSLTSLPVMYILNTKVSLPLSILPTYGALSFMPYSFKPLYAYISSFFPRRFLLNVGWACCALTTLAWMSVPSVPFVFLVGITNNIALSWSSFLLGLTLIDTATASASVALIGHSTNTTAANSSSSSYFEKAGSLFQSQAATARNMGSLIASVLTCFVFGMNQSEQQTALTEQVVNGIFFATAGCYIISFLLVFFCQDSFAPTTIIDLRQTTTEQEVEQRSPLSRRHSYAALEMSLVEENTSNTSIQEDHEHEHEHEPEEEEQQSTFCNPNVMVVAGLQLFIVALALKRQILYLLQQYAFSITILACLSIIILAVHMLRLCCTRTRTRNRAGAWIPDGFRKSWGRLHLVGLALILRHAVPSPSAVLYSFLYQYFQAQPIWLQVFSLVDNGAVTLASWSYEKLWAPRYSHGYKLITFMMATTVVSHSTGTLYTALVHYYNNEDGETSINLQSLFPWLVLGIKAISAFTSEWNFLPSVVLATISVSEQSSSSLRSPSSQASDDDDREAAADEPMQHSKVKELALATNITYGSYISCIDFGDQIGSILSTPLVRALGITRENNWHNLDILIFICSGIGVLSAGFLLLLLGKDQQQQRGHQRLQYF